MVANDAVICVNSGLFNPQVHNTAAIRQAGTAKPRIHTENVAGFNNDALDIPGHQHKRKQNEMFEASPNESPDRVESQSTPRVPLLKKDIPAFLADAAERYPLLIEVLDRVERELIREGVDLSRLA